MVIIQLRYFGFQFCNKKYRSGTKITFCKRKKTSTRIIKITHLFCINCSIGIEPPYGYSLDLFVCMCVLVWMQSEQNVHFYLMLSKGEKITSNSSKESLRSVVRTINRFLMIQFIEFEMVVVMVVVVVVEVLARS